MKFEGSSQDVSSNLRRHLRTCSKHNAGASPGIEGSLPKDAKNTVNVQSKRSSVKESKDVHQKIMDTTSTQQTSPAPRSIRSVYSSFWKKPSGDYQQKDGDKSKGGGNANDIKPAVSATSERPATTATPTSTTKALENNTKKSDSKKGSTSSSIGRVLPTPSSALAARISGDLPPNPRPPPDHKPSLSPSRALQDRKLSAPSSHSTLPLVRGHKGIDDSSPSSRQESHSSISGQVCYEGYTLTKCDSKQTGKKETWAVARMDPMPVSQEDLKNRIKRNRKKHVSALDEYNDEKMKGFKRKQVDHLVRERTKIDGDYGYEYVLASIKLESRKPKSKSIETVSMQVILKRQLIAGFPHEPLTGPSMDFHAKLPSRVMDLTFGNEREKVSDYGGGSQDVGHGGAVVSFSGHPEPAAFPMSPAHGQPFDHGLQHVDDRFPPFCAVPHPLDSFDPLNQGMRQPSDGHSGPAVIHQEIQDTQDHLEKVNNSKHRTKKKAPKVFHTNLETRKKRNHISNSSSLSSLSSESDSDNSWTKTDATPDTVVSGESRKYRKEKKVDKESKKRSYDKHNNEPMPYAYETQRPVYLHHRREEYRCSSLSPARRPSDVPSDWISREDSDLDLERHGRRASPPRRSYGPRYRDRRHYEVEPGTSFPADRASRHHRSSISPGRSNRGRGLSYDFAQPLAHNSKALAPTRSFDVYDREAELAGDQLEWERQMFQLRVREEAELRATRASEMDTRGVQEIRERAQWRREREEFLRDTRTERTKEMESRGEMIERQTSRRGTAYDDRFMPRPRRDLRYYY